MGILEAAHCGFVVIHRTGETDRAAIYSMLVIDAIA